MLKERGIYPNADFIDLYPTKPDHGTFEKFDGDETNDEDKNCLWNDVSSAEIQEAIIHALSKCPNQSCTMDSLTSRVLKEVGVLTRGNPRKVFERRVMRAVNALEEQGVVQKYKAKNNRVRLINKIFGLTIRCT